MDLENSEKSTKSSILELMDSILLIKKFPFALIYKAQAYNYKLARRGNSELRYLPQREPAALWHKIY